METVLSAAAVALAVLAALDGSPSLTTCAVIGSGPGSSRLTVDAKPANIRCAPVRTRLLDLLLR
eukprot:362822-Chlamydomonas_euryale.AAC.8